MLKPSVKQMLELGEACGLDTVGQAYDNYMSNYDMFFLLEELKEQVIEFHKELKKYGLDDYTNKSITEAKKKL